MWAETRWGTKQDVAKRVTTSERRNFNDLPRWKLRHRNAAVYVVPFSSDSFAGRHLCHHRNRGRSAAIRRHPLPLQQESRHKLFGYSGVSLVA